MDSRRNFVKKGVLLGSVLSLSPDVAFGSNFLNFSEKINIGIIGLGDQGLSMLSLLLNRKDVNVVALCDLNVARVELGVETLKNSGKKAALTFSGDKQSYLDLLSLKEVDAVIIATPHQTRIGIAIDAFSAEKFVGMEVPAANSVEECFDLIKAHEQNGSQLMIMDDLMFRRDMMAAMNMLKENVFGDVFHFKCSYQRNQNIESCDQHNLNNWVTNRHSKNADVYPSSGIAAMAAFSEMNRGNRFETLSTQVSKSAFLNQINKDYELHLNAESSGDVLTTVIKTANDQSIVIAYEGNNCSAQSIGIKIQGSLGTWDRQNQSIRFESNAETRKWDIDTAYLEKYDHENWKVFGQKDMVESHFMKHLTLDAFIQSAKGKIKPVLDVYDAATLGVIAPLSDLSVANDGAVQIFPDFTSGAWANANGTKENLRLQTV